jgi:hypothetical protein
MNNKFLLLKIALIPTLLAVGACSYMLFPGPSLQSTPTNNGSTLHIAYCGSTPAVLCVISFGLDNHARTLVNFVTPNPSFQDFYLIIKRVDKDSRYECQKAGGFPTSVYCIGEQIPLGEKVDLEVYSKNQSLLVAEGSLTILFYALPTPITVFATAIRVTITLPSGSITSLPPVSTLQATQEARPSATAPNSYPNPYPYP